MSIAPAQQSKQITIKQHLQSESFAAEISKALPAHCKSDRMIRVALTALTRTPKLAQCTPQSFFKCMLDLSQWGLEPDGRRAHLIPYENRKAGTVECQLIIDYKGLVELAYRSGVVKNIHADVVRTGDIFRYSMGKVLEHVPHFLRFDVDKPESEGNVFAVYCIIELIGDTTKTEVMSLDEVFAIRDRSQGYQAFKKGWAKTTPWESDTGEMCKKTAFRRASKWIPLSADIRDAFERDDDLVETAPAHKPRVSTIGDLGAMLNATSDDGNTIDGHTSDSPDTKPTHDIDPITAAAAKLADCQTLDEIDRANADILKLDLTDEQGFELSQLVEKRQAEIEAAGSRGKGKQKSFA